MKNRNYKLDYSNLCVDIAKKYNMRLLCGEDVNHRCYIYLDGLRVLNRYSFYENDTGYGDNIELAAKDLIYIYMNKNVRLRRINKGREYYYTARIRNMIRKAIRGIKQHV